MPDTIIATYSGQASDTTIDLTDTPPVNVTYYYYAEVIDSEGSPVTTDSNEAPPAGFMAVPISWTVSASDTVHFSDAAQGPVDRNLSASDTVHFTDVASASLYLGRFRRGDVIPFSVFLASLPNAAPTLTLSDNPPGNTYATYQMPWLGGTVFGVNLRLSGPIGNLALGTFRLTANYSIGGVAGSQVFKFDLVDGGDSGGEVIALYVFERPEQRYVVAQLASGQLVQGKNPHL